MKTSRFYIVDKAVNCYRLKHIIKLDRTLKHLIVYELVTNDRLYEYYDICESFEFNNYIMYEEICSFKCIYGGAETPTPEGTFSILSKSNNEYVSHYYSGYDRVKFFGYLVVFEDYFIHSDLYEDNIDIKDLKNDTIMQSIGMNDDHTSGCVRVSRNNLDWLLKNIEVGTMVIL